jgi:hypothetical protein
MSKINISQYTPADRVSCIALLKTTFPGNSDENTFKWRFESNLLHAPIIICARDQNRVISFNSWLPWEFLYKDKTYLGYQSGESATYKEYRRKGIWSKVLNFADEIARENNSDFLFGFPSHMSYKSFYNAGYCPIGIFAYRLRLVNPLSSSIEEKTDKKVIKLSSDYPYERNKITPINNDTYFNWRYVNNTKRYLFLEYNENNNQAVFIVRPSEYINKRYHISVKEINLLDCNFTSYNEIFIRNAFKHIDKTFSRRALYIKSFISENTDRGRAIKKHFHVKLKSRFETLCVKPIRKNIEKSIFFNHNNWDILPHVIDEI